MNLGARREVAVDGGDTSSKAGSLNLHPAILFEIHAECGYRLVQTHARVASLAHKLAVGNNLERRKREVFLFQAALGQEFADPFGVELFKRLQRSDAQLLRVNPPKHFFRFHNSLQGGHGLLRMNAAQRLDGFQAQVRPSAHGQVPVGQSEQSPQRFAVRGHADFVDEQGHHHRIDMVEQDQQNAATPWRSAPADLANDPVLRRARKIFHAPREKNFSGLRIELAK